MINRQGEGLAAGSGTTAVRRSQEHDQYGCLHNCREGLCRFEAYRKGALGQGDGGKCHCLQHNHLQHEAWCVCQVQGIEKAAQLREDINELNIEQDIITYSTIVLGYCMSGEINLALSLL